MLSSQFRGSLTELVEGRVLFDESMKNHTSIRIGGPADALIVPESETDLKRVLSFAQKNNIRVTVIGNGTKLLVSDDGIDGIVLKISGCLDLATVIGTTASVEAGYSLASLARLAAQHGLSGLEFAVGIPGTVGAAVVMNAGAHECMMSDVITMATVMDFAGATRRMPKNMLGFGYRQSVLQGKNLIVLGVEIELAKDDPAEIEKRMLGRVQWRRRNQPLDMPNAGSIFKNPKGMVAGKLIDDVGLKGMRVGGAMISTMRANFIVNAGNAKAEDVKRLMEMARKEVLEKFNVMLEPEIQLIERHY